MATYTINTSIIHSSLKYVNSNFKLTVKLSKWIYEELVKINYKDSKLLKSLDLKCYDIIESILYLVENKNNFSRRLIDGYSLKDDTSELLNLIPMFIKFDIYIGINNKIFISNACYHRRIDILKLLITHKEISQSTKDTLLLDECTRGCYEIIEILIDNGANIYYSRHCPILVACINKNIQIVKLLIKRGKYNKDMIIKEIPKYQLKCLGKRGLDNLFKMIKNES
jgi:hypothetical protein